MTKRLFLSVLLTYLVILAPTSAALASYSMLDQTVRESVEAFFYELNFEVNLDQLTHEIVSENSSGELLVRSYVWAEQRRIAPYWGLYECTTQLQRNPNDTYEDLGSECFFNFD